MTAPLRLIFAGTPDFAAAHLQVLLDSPHEVIACYTQPDRPAGRGKQLKPSPVKLLAQSHGVDVYQPVSLKTPESAQQLANLGADLMVVVAYGLILPATILEAPRLGCVNVHASLLPRWRGAAPIQRAIEAGDAQTGITIMQMDAGLDTGAMLVKTRCDIEATDTAGSLHDRLLAQGGPALLQALELLGSGLASPEAQDDSEATYAAKISKAEAEIDWRQSAVAIDRKIRAFTPFPIAYSRRPSAPTEAIRIWQANPAAAAGSTPGQILSVSDTAICVACGEGSLNIHSVQLPGKRAMAVADILRGNRDLFVEGEHLGLVE